MVSVPRNGSWHAQGSVSSGQPQREAGTPNAGRGKRNGDDRSGQSGAELTTYGKVGHMWVTCGMLPNASSMYAFKCAELLRVGSACGAAVARTF